METHLLFLDVDLSQRKPLFMPVMFPKGEIDSCLIKHWTVMGLSGVTPDPTLTPPNYYQMYMSGALETSSQGVGAQSNLMPLVPGNHHTIPMPVYKGRTFPDSFTVELYPDSTQPQRPIRTLRLLLHPR